MYFQDKQQLQSKIKFFYPPCT